jgi:hypothetical protein
VAEFVADGSDLERLVVEDFAQGGVFVELDVVQKEGDVLILEAVVLGPDFGAGEDYSYTVYDPVCIGVVLAEIDGIVCEAAGFFNREVGGFVGIRVCQAYYGAKIEIDRYRGIKLAVEVLGGGVEDRVKMFFTYRKGYSIKFCPQENDSSGLLPKGTGTKKKRYENAPKALHIPKIQKKSRADTT